MSSYPSTRLRWSFDGQAGVYCWAWRSIRTNGIETITWWGFFSPFVVSLSNHTNIFLLMWIWVRILRQAQDERG